MKRHRLKSAAALAALAIGIGAMSSSAYASFIVSASVGGAAAGVNYDNFDTLPAGSGGGTSNGVTVSFAPDGGAVMGNVSGIYAAPFLSGTNGTNFGNGPGVDTTQFLTTGLGSVTLTFGGNTEQYLGLLWGSVDAYNNLTFYRNGVSVGTVNGVDVLAGANGDQGVNGTLYANIVSTLAFDTVVATSTQYAFEFDNLAYNTTPPTNPVPEPFSLSLVGLGMVGIGASLRRRKNAAGLPMNAETSVV